MCVYRPCRQAPPPCHADRLVVRAGTGGVQDQKPIPLVAKHPGTGEVDVEQPAIRPSHHHADGDMLKRRDQRGERRAGFTGEHRIAAIARGGHVRHVARDFSRLATGTRILALAGGVVSRGYSWQTTLRGGGTESAVLFPVSTHAYREPDGIDSMARKVTCKEIRCLAVPAHHTI